MNEELRRWEAFQTMNMVGQLSELKASWRRKRPASDVPQGAVKSPAGELPMVLTWAAVPKLEQPPNAHQDDMVQPPPLLVVLAPAPVAVVSTKRKRKAKKQCDLPLPTTADFFRFMVERESLRRRKEREPGNPEAWTADPILRKYKFTNVQVSRHWCAAADFVWYRGNTITLPCASGGSRTSSETCG